MRIPQEVIDNIRNHVDIVDVVSHYVPLTRKGKSYKCICPFHDDHDPSLSVSQEKQIFNCFVCGTGGNVFTFVQKYENVSFLEAVKKVADMGNIHLDYDFAVTATKPVDPHIAALHKVTQETINYCAYELDSVEARSVKQYLYSRGLSDEIIKRFELGYNPKGNRLYEFLHAKNYRDQDIIGANLAWITPQGIKDVFMHRIMIPIHDANGNPVGFSARRIDEMQEAKYINTAETDVYVKGKLIYNYHRAKEHCKKAGRVIMVEGAMDVLAFEKAGIHYSIAALGTACTKEQLQLIRKLGVKVVLCYDGDKAGQDATYKFYQAASAFGMQVEIVNNKYRLDPDEIIEAYGKEELISMIDKTISWIDFLFVYLQDRYNLDNYSQKKEYAKQIANEIERMQDDFEKTSYYMRLAQISGFDMRLEEGKAPLNVPKKRERKPQVILHPKDGKTNAQMLILSQMLLSKRACEYYRNELGFLLDEYDSLALYIIDYYRKNDRISIADLIDCIKEENIRMLLLKIVNWELALNTYNEDVLKEAVSKIKGILTEERIRKLLEDTNHVNDPMEKAKIAQEIILLKREQGGFNNG